MNPIYNQIPILLPYKTCGPITSAATLLSDAKKYLLGYISGENLATCGTFSMSFSSRTTPSLTPSDSARENLFYPLSFSIFDADAAYFVKLYNHNAYMLCFTLDGCGFLEYEQKSYILSSGEGFLIDCRRPFHCGTHGDRWLSTNLFFDGSHMGCYFQQYAEAGSVKFNQSQCPNIELRQVEIVRLAEQGGALNEFRISNCFTALLTDLVTGHSQMPRTPSVNVDTVSSVLQFMEENYSTDITIKTISQKFGISQSYLSHKFKEYVGVPIAEYMIQIRMHAAKELLLRTNDSLELVSDQVGFHNTSHFIQTFKKRTGMTPTQYRKRNVG